MELVEWNGFLSVFDLEEVNLIHVNSIVIYYNINSIVLEQRIV